VSPADDPLAEAGRWLDARLAGAPIPELLIVLGLGEGHLLDLLEARAPGTRVLAIEPDLEAARAFRSRRDCTSWLQSGRLLYLVDPDYAGADEGWRLFPTNSDAHTLLVNPSIERNAGAAAVRAARVLKDILFGVRANAAARRQFAPRYLLNSLRNAPAIAAGHDVRVLTDVYRGVPAVIAAAGPSLDHAIEPLRAAAGRALLISADTALRPLLNAGLAPQLVVALDPSELNGRHFLGLPQCPDTWLVSESALDPSASGQFGERTFWFRVANHQPWPWYHQLGLDVGLLSVWGSVITAAFQVAVLAGCDPIVVVGADLSYTGGQPYCRGTTFEFDWARWAATGVGLAEIWTWMTGAATARVADLRGVEAMTTPSLLAFRDWLVAHTARSGRRVINATGAGMFFGTGIEQMSLEDALPAVSNVPAIARMAHVARRSFRPSDLAARFREMSAAIAADPSAPVAARWAAFSGAGWNPEATVAALDEATRALEGNATPLDHLGAVHADARRVVGQLPEALSRWRAVLLGLELSPAPTNPTTGRNDAAALLVEAMNLLEHICDIAQSGADGPAPRAAEKVLARLPLSLVYGWPARMAWEVLTFQALLGVASARSFPKHSFFSTAVIPRDSTEHGGPGPTLVCALLALEWAMCVKSLDQGGWTDTDPVCAWRLRASSASVRPAGTDGEGLAQATLVMAARVGQRSRTVELPIFLDERGLARMDTGVLHALRREPGGSDAATPRVELLASASVPGRSASLTMRSFVHDPGEGPTVTQRADAARVAPRILTDENVPSANIAYTTSRGAVCIIPLTDVSSFVVLESGATEPLHSWPLPIFNELPFGQNGVAAWGWNADAQPGYIMYREDAGAAPIVERLPFIPLWGVWWRDRLYWTTPRSGLGSWAPGTAPVLALPDLTLIAIDSCEDGLLLSPCVRDDSGSLLRQRARRAWRWRDDGPPQAVSLGPFGAATSRSTGSDGWTATAYAEADIVQLESAGGRVLSMTCYYPFKVAWLGRSLLISTLPEDLLLFEDLIGRLPAAVTP
jgi:6-hydroxymethylpterin diphosphokinase MptE-like protein